MDATLYLYNVIYDSESTDTSLLPQILKPYLHLAANQKVIFACRDFEVACAYFMDNWQENWQILSPEPHLHVILEEVVTI